MTCTATSWKGSATNAPSFAKDNHCNLKSEHDIHRDKHGNSFVGTGPESHVVVLRNGKLQAV